MKRSLALGMAALVAVPALLLALSCQQTRIAGGGESPRVESGGTGDARLAHEQRVMESSFCSGCHPAIYAEHAQNTHGRAFTDEEVRLATGRFAHGDCIRCHTPRPVFETGIGMNPMQRHYGLEEGNSCMTCHWKPDYDYGGFHGGEQCTNAFDPRVGDVEACASCHRNHGTPYQWEIAPTGKQKNRKCMTCHMQLVKRPVAVGQPPRRVRSHVFPGSRSEQQLRRAYRYDANIDGNQVVVRIENKGTGHNFPTELKQRSLESVVVVRDEAGNEIARSRMVFRDPYKRPYGLMLPVNTQIPAGETREHRVPINVASGSVETELHFKLYFPIADYHPELARRLEARRLAFTDITPSTETVEAAAEVAVVLPEAITISEASPANLVDFARPPIGTVAIEIPGGKSDTDIAKLIELFQFPVPEGNAQARDRLVEIGAPAIPGLVEALGSWDNKTWKQAMAVLAKMRTMAEPAVFEALVSDQLYVRIHARQLVPRMGWQGDRAALFGRIATGLELTNALDRASALEALGVLGAAEHTAAMRTALADRDPDVVRAAAIALGRLGDESAVPDLEAALGRAYFVETQRDVATAAAMLGSTAGIPVLLEGLDHRDALIRESFFESLFAVTGLHFGFDPLAPRPERLNAIAELQAHWAENGSPDLLRRPPRPDLRTDAYAWKLVSALGGGAGTVPGGDDAELKQELIAMGGAAVPALVKGLKFAAGFADKRALVCECLGNIRSPEAAPALAATLRDPVLAVAAWACWALEHAGDAASQGALLRYQDRLLTLTAAGRIPAHLQPADRLIVQAARTRLLLGDKSAMQDLVALLMSDDDLTRRQAIDGLERKFGERRGYDPEASREERSAAAARWAR